MTAGRLLSEASSAELTEWMGFGEFEAEQAAEPPRDDTAKLTGGL